MKSSLKRKTREEATDKQEEKEYLLGVTYKVELSNKVWDVIIISNIT